MAHTLVFCKIRYSMITAYGGMAELAYAGDLKSFAERLVGSNPTTPTSAATKVQHAWT